MLAIPPEAAAPNRPQGAQAVPPAPLLSVVVPVRNEAANIQPLIAEIRAALAGIGHAGIGYEIVYVDDGSTDGTAAQLLALQATAGQTAANQAGPGQAGPAQAELPGALVLRRHRSSCGQSAAIVTGVRAARGAWIATLDGDGQNDPADIPALFARAQAEPGSLLLVAGHRTRRRDSWTKRHSSRVANKVRAALLHDATPDTGCGLKVFQRAAFLELPCFDHMHRYLPALFIRAGGQVVSVPVNHRPRTRGQSNYGTLDRLWVGLFDLVGVAWLQRRWKRPHIEQP